MTSATQTKHMASVCWHITVDRTTGKVLDRDVHEEWTLDMYHNTVQVYIDMLNQVGARGHIDSWQPLVPYDIPELIHDEDMDLPWMMRKDLNIQGRNIVVRRWDKEHHIGIAYVA